MITQALICLAFHQMYMSGNTACVWQTHWIAHCSEFCKEAPLLRGFPCATSARVTEVSRDRSVCPEELVRKRVKDPGDFEWLKQCRFYWRDDKDTVIISICDRSFEYSFEYLGGPDSAFL